MYWYISLNPRVPYNNQSLLQMALVIRKVGIISLLGGKFAPKLVYFVQWKELLNFSETAPRFDIWITSAVCVLYQAQIRLRIPANKQDYCDMSMTLVWPECDLGVTWMWPHWNSSYLSMTLVWPKCDLSMTVVWPECDLSVTWVWPECDLSVTAVAGYYRTTTVVSLPYKLLYIEILLFVISF